VQCQAPEKSGAGEFASVPRAEVGPKLAQARLMLRAAAQLAGSVGNDLMVHKMNAQITGTSNLSIFMVVNPLQIIQRHKFIGAVSKFDQKSRRRRRGANADNRA
jgi:hypothetical protein